MCMKMFYEKYPNFIEPDNFAVFRISKRTWRYRNYEQDNTLPDFKHFPIIYEYDNDLLNFPSTVAIERERLCRIYSNILNRNYCENI